MNTTTSTGIERYILLVILVVALGARFRYLAQIEHNVDHAYPVWQAMRTIDEGIFPLAGQGTSVLFANPPLTGYLFVPAMALTRSIIGVYVFVIALNWLAVWMAYRAARSLLGIRAGLVAAGLMAVNPWVIEYSRTSWVQSVLPFFVCAVAWLLWPVLMNQSRRPERRLALALVMTALLTQTHLLAYLMLATVGALLLIFWQRLPRRSIAVGAAAILAVSVLYGAGLATQWDTVLERVQNFSTGEARFKSEALEAGIRLVTGAEYEVARGLDAPAGDAAARHDLSQVAHYVLLGAILVGIGAAALEVWRRGERCDAGVIALVWFGLPIAAMTYTGSPVHPFYQLLGIPAGYALVAWGLRVVLRYETSRWGAAALIALAVPFAALMLTNSARYYQETAVTPGEHGLTALPVDYGVCMGAAINRHLLPDGVVYAGVEGWIINSFAGRLFPVVEDTRAPAFNFVPASGGVYIDIAPHIPPIPAMGQRVESFQMPDGHTLTVDYLPPPDAASVPGQRLDVPSQQGITLLSYDLPGEGDTWTLTTIWRVDFVEPEVYERIFAPFLHVHEGDRGIVNISGEGLMGFLWHPGDLHIHRMTFTLPEDASPPLTLRVGQYDGLHNANVIFTPPDGEPTTVIELPGGLP
jgi:4-amino-4-deoxy-L-arabinose transferase-like glycosyltransferase